MTNKEDKYKLLNKNDSGHEFDGWTENDFIKHILALREELGLLHESLDKMNAEFQKKIRASDGQDEGIKQEEF